MAYSDEPITHRHIELDKFCENSEKKMRCLHQEWFIKNDILSKKQIYSIVSKKPTTATTVKKYHNLKGNALIPKGFIPTVGEWAIFENQTTTTMAYIEKSCVYESDLRRYLQAFIFPDRILITRFLYVLKNGPSIITSVKQKKEIDYSLIPFGALLLKQNKPSSGHQSIDDMKKDIRILEMLKSLLIAKNGQNFFENVRMPEIKELTQI